MVKLRKIPMKSCIFKSFLTLITCCLMTSVQYSVFELHCSVCSPQSPHVCCSKKTNCKNEQDHLESSAADYDFFFKIITSYSAIK